jgi:hypothetical protein
VIFPCRQHHRVVNLYGRGIGTAFPRLLPRPKGGLFAWESVRHFSHVILVEGVFDLALFWQEGFRNTTCAIGTHLPPCSGTNCVIPRIAKSTLSSIRTTTRPVNRPLGRSPSACTLPVSHRHRMSAHWPVNSWKELAIFQHPVRGQADENHTYFLGVAPPDLNRMNSAMMRFVFGESPCLLSGSPFYFSR